ncbi:terminase small subunit [Virgibacillus sp. C22-A2]|uniref:Terminase small subunit n=1 Tax=Virgibacillus tibetensis TaxID=3042313 RepID=A0ABU6K9W1_9BACI|nr:terminase small subunit [Virgibacillus sp. C22-A2]
MNEKQRRFADYYIETGNITESAVRAGYSKNYANAQGYKLLDNVGIRKYIEERNKQLESQRIANMTEVKEFWTNTIRDEELDYKDRLKASEYIAKTNAAFIDRTEQTGDMSININVKGSKGNEH